MTNEEIVEQLTKVAKKLAEQEQSRDAAVEDLQTRLAALESRHIKPIKPQENLEPDKHWSFDALPKDTDLRRILTEAEQAGARAVGIVLCGINTAWIRKDVVAEAAGTSGMFDCHVRVGSKFVTPSDWNWYGIVCAGDPAQVARQALAELDKWAARKWRTSVACWR